MRRLAVAALVAVVVALAGAGATFAGADHGHGKRGGLTFFSTENALALLPVVAGKFSLGDRVVFSDDVFTAKGGTQVGTMAVSAPSCASPTRRRGPASFSASSPSRYQADRSPPRR
jgi:hypothetical protein